MKKGKPFSALYYISQNKGQAGICIFMMLLSTLMFLAGNYIHSVMYSFEKEFDYSDKLVRVCIQNTDEEYKDYYAVREDIEKDTRLMCTSFSCKGFGGMAHKTVLDLEVGGNSFIFQSKEDMEKVFSHLGIEADLSACGDRSIVISKQFAKNKGLKLGDKVDHSFDSCFSREYTVNAIIDDGSYAVFYIYEDMPENCLRMYVYSDTMEGSELRDYVKKLVGDRNVLVASSYRDAITPEFQIFYVLFYLIDILIAVVLSVTINAVVTGHYYKRTFEFGVYRAIGKGKWTILKKVSGEIMSMNLLATSCGFVLSLVLTYLMNELVYKPKGMYLLYFSGIGLIGFLICDALIVIPMILSNARKMNKVDVTEF